jgi:MGT family glycosyltransferase
MSRILAYTSPARGHLFPLTPILDELQRRGHRISLRTLESEVPMMESQGFHTAAIDAQVENLVMQDWHGGNSRKALELGMLTFCARARFDVIDLQRAIEQEDPDALIVDINSWGAMAAAEAWGGTWTTFCPYPMFLRSPDAPPFGPGLAPARGPLGRLRDRVVGPIAFGMLEKQMLQPINAVRAGVGLAPFDSADELFLHSPLTIYMTAEPFEYPRRDWPESIVMVGPCEWEPPADPPPWLDGIERPIVLVTTSSEFQDDGELAAVAMEALADEPVEVIVTLPSGNPEDFRVPTNARVQRFLPHGPILDVAACAVTHGGMGATQKALARGVPVCAVPFGRDQLEVARRVVVCGAGTRLPARRLRADRLRAKVREAIAMKQGAMRIADAFKSAGGPPAAADAIERRMLTPPGIDRTKGPALGVTTLRWTTEK